MQYMFPFFPPASTQTLVSCCGCGSEYHRLDRGCAYFTTCSLSVAIWRHYTNYRHYPWIVQEVLCWWRGWPGSQSLSGCLVNKICSIISSLCGLNILTSSPPPPTPHPPVNLELFYGRRWLIVDKTVPLNDWFWSVQSGKVCAGWGKVEKSWKTLNTFQLLESPTEAASKISLSCHCSRSIWLCCHKILYMPKVAQIWKAQTP